MKKRVDIFLTKVDEAELSAEIRKQFPKVVFIDEFESKTGQPIEKDSIVDCESKFIRIWNKDLYPVFEQYDRGDSELPIPPRIVVIFMNRSSHLDPTTKITPKENNLISGTISASLYDDYPKCEEMFNFINQIWKILKKITTKRISVVSLNSGEIINDKPYNIVAGKNAIEWCKADSERYFKSHSVQVYYKPTV